MQVYNKLVRDRIPEIIAKNGKNYEAVTLSKEEYRVELRKKLLEEVNEYLESTADDEAVVELADVLEVVHALADVHGEKFEGIEEVRREKVKERGGFAERVFLKSVE